MIRVGVVRGGVSNEHEVSLKTGAAVLACLGGERYEPVDIFLDRAGRYYSRGAETNLARLAHSVDCVVNALHGAHGEDGKIQSLFERFGISYTGSGVVPSAVAMHKTLAKERFRAAGIRTPVSARFRTLCDEDGFERAAIAAFRAVPPPYVVKPVSGGSSLGVSFADDFSELLDALRASGGGEMLVEERVIGREATCGVVENFRGELLYALPPVEILPPAGAKFFDYEAKYGGGSREIVPGNFTRAETEELERLAKAAHRALGLRHYSRTDFILSPRGVFALEVNTLPGLTEESLFPKSLEAVGVPLGAFLDHLVSLALAERGR